MNDYNQGDCGSMDEDLAVLGLKPLTESQGTRGESGTLVEDTQEEGKVPPAFLKHIKKKDDDSDDKDDDKDDDSDDDSKEEAVAADGRTEVDPRTEEDEESDEDAEPVTESTMIGFDQMVEIAEQWEIEPIDFIDFLNEQFGIDPDMFFTEEEIAALAEDEGNVGDEPSFGPKTEAAHSVLGMFYAHMEQITESEEVEEDSLPSYDNLVGVIESYEHVHDDLLEDVEEILEAEDLEEAKKGFRRLKAKLKLGRRKFMKQAGGKKLKRVQKRMHDRGMHLVGGKKMRAGAYKRHLRMKLKGASGKYARSIRSKIKSSKNSTIGAGVEDNGTPLSELVSNLNSLRDQVNEQDDVTTAGDELLEGLKSIYDVATSYFTRIAEEVQESEDVAEDDARVVVGRHLEKIAEDARRVAEGLVEGNGEFTLDDYADDLTALAADLDESMEAMKAID